MDERVKWVLVLLAAALLAAGCGQGNAPEQAPTVPPPPDTPAANAARERRPETTASVAGTRASEARTPDAGGKAAGEMAPEQLTAEAFESGTGAVTAPAEAAPEQLTAEAFEGGASAGTATGEAAEARETGTPEAVEMGDPTAMPTRLENMTFTNVLTGEAVRLVNGLHEEPAAPGSATMMRVGLSDWMAFVEVSGRYRAAAILISEGGGSGTFYSLHLVGLENGEPRELGSVLLGDRVRVHELALDDEGAIAVEMTRAGEDDPLCCPTERVRQVYRREGEELALAEESMVEGSRAGGSTEELVERGVSLEVTGVAETYTWVIEQAAPEAEPPLPGRLVMAFDGEGVGQNGRALTIFPLGPYLALAEGEDGGQTAVGDQVARLWDLAETGQGRTGAAQGWMPLLPPGEERIEDWRDFAALDFGQGRGVRYVREMDGKPAYTFQGITEDGDYYVSLTWPLGTAEGAELEELEALDGMVGSLALGEMDDPSASSG